MKRKTFQPKSQQISSKPDFPIVNEDLIEALEKTFSHPAHSPTTLYSMIMYNQGQQSVIDFLKHQLKLQTTPVIKE